MAQELVAVAAAKGLTIALAESCTGGMLAATITDIAGSSAVLQASFVTYSNLAKIAMLHVPKNVLCEHGAVSSEIAAAMADGVIKNLNVNISLSITGIAGPGGGSAAKPIGTVWFGYRQYDNAVKTECLHFHGSRAEIRQQAVAHALKILQVMIVTMEGVKDE